MPSREDFYDAIEKSESFPPSQIGELRDALFNPAMLAALKSAMDTITGGVQDFRQLDLSTPDGVARAVRLQGQGDGVIMLIDHLYDLTLEEDKDGS